MSKLIAKVTEQERIIEEVNEIPHNPYDMKWVEREANLKSWITDDLDLKDGQEVYSEDYDFIWQGKAVSTREWRDYDTKPSAALFSRQIARKKVKEEQETPEQAAEFTEKTFGEALLKNILSKQEEIICSPIRQQVVSVADIIKCFKELGISVEILF